jgi:hypothetical protein
LELPGKRETGGIGMRIDIGKEIASTLEPSDFGTPEETAEKAKPIRTAKSRNEAKLILDEIASKGALRSADGVEATISGKSKREILSGKSSRNSFEKEAHWQAVANIDKLYSNAIEKQLVELVTNKDNRNLESRKFLYSPMTYKKRIILVKFTVFEYKIKQNKLRLYNIEAIDIELGQKNNGAGMSGPDKLKPAYPDTPSKAPLI